MRHSIIALAILGACGPAEDPTDSACSDEAGTICLFAGQTGVAQFGPEDVLATESPLYLPQDMTFGPDGTAYFLDFNNHRIRAIDTDGYVHTIAGTGMLGDGPEGPARIAAFNHPTNLAFDPNNPDVIHVAAWHNSRVEMVNLVSGQLEFTCGTGGRAFGGDEGPARDAVLDLPSAIAFDEDSNLFISDQANQLIRMVDTDGIIHTVAGLQRQEGYSGDGGPALEAQFHASVGQAADPSSRITIHDRTLYLADTDNHVIRAIDLDTWIIDTVVGMGEMAGYAGDGGMASDAMLRAPRDVAFDDAGTMYIADTDNHCIRRVGVDGVIDTVAGVCGVPGAEGDGGAATEALMNRPYGITIGPDGDLYVADTQNHVFRVVHL